MSSRKTVTVVFCDVVDSTRRAEQLDPEQVRATMDRYFKVARQVLESHGGTVEKFIGDAVLAVFGIPTVHEDDAVRALRAASDLLAAVHELDSLDVRMGINSGEVVAAEDAGAGTFVTGDAVNVAARLQQAAQPGEILVGEGTRRLARGAATFERIDPVSAKGKSAPVEAYRLVSVEADYARELGTTRLVGRMTELDGLRATVKRVEETHTPDVITVVGTAGVGKSRLVAELLTEIEPRVPILRGRCLPYGDGVTYFPLTQLVKAAAGITDTDDLAEARKKLGALVGQGPEAAEVAKAIASAIGLDPSPVHEEEIFWAARRLLEQICGSGLLVVVIEDIHWAEPAFLDLLEYLGDFIASAAVLVICLCRPDLFERRASWGRARPGSSLIALDSLPAAAAYELFDQLDGSAAVEPALRERILEAAEGNPLYVEEMLAMLVEEGHLVRDGESWQAAGSALDIQIPPTIGALLAARIDGLPEKEREVAERASVIGRVFEASAVRELVSRNASDDIGRNLLALVRKEFIRPDRAELSIGDAYKFRHILIRDAAYRALPKSDRASLHEAFADWLERAAGDRIAEYGEILGFHLEQAHAYRTELGLRDDRSVALAKRAVTWLGRAADRASDRGDGTARVLLAERALRLAPETDADFPKLAIGLARGLTEAGELARALELVNRVLALPNISEGSRAMARIDRAFVREELGFVTVDELRREIAATTRPLLRSGERAAVVAMFQGLAGSYQNMGDVERAERYLRRAANLAERWAIAEEQVFILLSLAGLGARTAMAATEAIALCERAIALPAFNRAARPAAFETLAYLHAQRGQFDVARSYLARSETSALEMGRFGRTIQTAVARGLIERFAGRFEDAADAFLAAYAEQRKLTGGQGAMQGFVVARLAQALVETGRLDEARGVLQEISESSADSDGWTTTIAGGSKARLMAAEGHTAEGLELARQIVERARTDRLDRLVILFGNALEDLATCAEAAGETTEAADAWSEAFDLYNAKGDVADADRLSRSGRAGAAPRR